MDDQEIQQYFNNEYFTIELEPILSYDIINNLEQFNEFDIIQIQHRDMLERNIILQFNTVMIELLEQFKN